MKGDAGQVGRDGPVLVLHVRVKDHVDARQRAQRLIHLLERRGHVELDGHGRARRKKRNRQGHVGRPAIAQLPGLALVGEKLLYSVFQESHVVGGGLVGRVITGRDPVLLHRLLEIS